MTLECIKLLFLQDHIEIIFTVGTFLWNREEGIDITSKAEACSLRCGKLP